MLLKNLIIAYFFLAFVISISVGASALILFKKYQIKSSVKALMKDLTDSELLAIKVSYVPGAENLDEFEVDGEFYDVARYKIQGDKITYFCYFDSADTRLQILSNHLHQVNNVTKKRSQLSHLLKMIDIKYVPSRVLQKAFPKFESILFPREIEKIPDYQLTIFTPPPQLC